MKKEIEAAKEAQEETKKQKEEAKKQKDEVIEEVRYKFGKKILTKEAMLFQMLFDKNFSKYGKYYKGKRIKFELVKTVKIYEMRTNGTEGKEKAKEEKTGKEV
jgi:hypothetical protein